jgi:hypothetical protein
MRGGSTWIALALFPPSFYGRKGIFVMCSLRRTVLLALIVAAISCAGERNAAPHTGPDTTVIGVPGESQVKVDSLFSPALGGEKH